MSGAVGYHLRTNKAVERKIFIDLLQKLTPVHPIKDYTYVGFGGPMLEDFREAHQAIGFKKMISIEQNSEVYKRQNFNIPFSHIDLIKSKSGNFIDSYNLEENAVIWLDYGGIDIEKYLQETHRLLKKLQKGDVFKITLVANPDNYYRPSSDRATGYEDENQALVLKAFVDQIPDDYIPSEISINDMNMEGLPRMLSKALDVIFAEYAESENELKVIPITRFRYIDHSHQIFTLTSVISNKTLNQMTRRCGISEWDIISRNSDDIKEIAMPALTQKEKLVLDQELPDITDDKLADILDKHRVHDRRAISDKLIHQYRQYYRYYPNYQRVNP